MLWNKYTHIILRVFHDIKRQKMTIFSLERISQGKGIDIQGEMWELCVWEAPQQPPSQHVI